ncbi:MAG: M48 family metalloprotease [Verrucomicrobia bacterium]|nr:M48 family metalloprotease [Verrucomicrobiota bacterium]
MKSKPSFSKVGFLKSYLLPVLIMFLIPGFGLWFFNHVETHFDQEIRESLISQIKADQTMSAEERKQAIKFYERTSVSRILASNKPGAEEMQKHFSPVRTRYAIFRWMKRAGLICLLTGVGAFVIVGIGVLFSFRSQRAQYWSLRVGWNVLRWFALIQVVGQGALAVALSFWVTAFWAERYYVKLILIAALFALMAVGLLVKAIFSKVVSESEFEGRLLNKEAAPSLWQRVSEMATKLNIAPPDNIFVGIDDNFFVTEHPVKVGGQRLEGRTLFASLSLLKSLSRSEADAVLAHELAHFSGEDTLYSRRISPLLGKYVHYLNALYQGGISRPVFHFMFFFWNLYQISLGKLSREREFRADRIGGELTSPKDMANALIKISAYCRYRHKVQKTLFEKEENVETMDVSARIEKGFPDFMTACVTTNELAESDTPHPFDSHPPLAGRLTSLGLNPESALKSPVNLPALGDSWFSAIDGAAEIEAEQWKAFEDMFHKVHQENLAWRFKPEGETEINHVMKYFPEVQFSTAKGLTATLNYEKVRVSEWDAPVTFASIASCRVDEHLGRQRLIIDYQAEGQAKKQNHKVHFKDFKTAQAEANFLQSFEKYYGRHMTAKKYHELKDKPKPEANP